VAVQLGDFYSTDSGSVQEQERSHCVQNDFGAVCSLNQISKSMELLKPQTLQLQNGQQAGVKHILQGDHVTSDNVHTGEQSLLIDSEQDHSSLTVHPIHLGHFPSLVDY
jgi:hypothetical protein